MPKREEKRTIKTNRYILEIIDELKTRRKELKWTQQKLADEAGLNRLDIVRFENLMTDPTLGLVIQVANAMDYKLVILHSLFKDTRELIGDGYYGLDKTEENA